jgi:hypothetical protein
MGRSKIKPYAYPAESTEIDCDASAFRRLEKPGSCTDRIAAVHGLQSANTRSLHNAGSEKFLAIGSPKDSAHTPLHRRTIFAAARVSPASPREVPLHLRLAGHVGVGTRNRHLGRRGDRIPRFPSPKRSWRCAPAELRWAG